MDGNSTDNAAVAAKDCNGIAKQISPQAMLVPDITFLTLPL